MTPAFGAGLVLLLPLAFVVRGLERSRQRLDGCSWLTALRPTIGAPVAPASNVGLPPVPDPESRVAAKAGQGRREPEPPPCHDCTCCTAYAPRLAAAHAEIDRLRQEIEAGDARRINHGNWATT